MSVMPFHLLGTTTTRIGAAGSLIVVGTAIACVIAAPFVVYPIFLMKLLCTALFAAAFNLLFGYTGVLSFGHAAFFGGAAYFTGYAAKVWGWDPVSAIAFGTVLSMALGVVIGFLAIRRQGIQFAMITLALSQLVYFVFLQVPFTHGEDGIQDIPRGTLFGVVDLNNNIAMYYFVAAIVLVAFWFIWRVVNSPYGRILKALHGNERRAISLGYNTERYKLGVFVMSAGLAGLAGALKALVFQIATLSDVTYQTSGEAIIMTILGGVGTQIGPLVGACMMVIMDSAFASIEFPVTVVIGFVFMLCVLSFRRGVVGELSAAMKR